MFLAMGITGKVGGATARPNPLAGHDGALTAA